MKRTFHIIRIVVSVLAIVIFATQGAKQFFDYLPQTPITAALYLATCFYIGWYLGRTIPFD